MKNKMFSAILSVTDISDQTERILLTLMLNLNYTNSESLQNAKIDERGLYHLLPILQASFIRVYHVIISDWQRVKNGSFFQMKIEEAKVGLCRCAVSPKPLLFANTSDKHRVSSSCRVHIAAHMEDCTCKVDISLITDMLKALFT